MPDGLANPLNLIRLVPAEGAGMKLTICSFAILACASVSAFTMGAARAA
jgi:hypothetical protein